MYGIHDHPDTNHCLSSVSFLFFLFAIMVNKARGKWGLNDDDRLSGELMMKVDDYIMLILSMYYVNVGDISWNSKGN